MIFFVLGLAGGAGGGLFLYKPAPAPDQTAEGAAKAADQGKKPPAQPSGETHTDDVEFVKLNNQFVVPIIGDARVDALVVMSLSLEVALGKREQVYLVEPKLRDAFLQAMFDHANAGGFNANFTQAQTMRTLRGALREVAVSVVGPDVRDVLIIDLVRQDNS